MEGTEPEAIVQSEEARFQYDLFISYESTERALARRLQSVLHKLARPWYRRRSLRVFLDETDIPATSSLPQRIEDAIQKSRFFLTPCFSQSLPPNLFASFPVEPLWLTLSAASSAAEIRIQAAITATIKELDLADLISEDARVHRKNLVAAWTAGVLLIGTTVSLGVATYGGMQNRSTISSQQKRIADERVSTLREFIAKETAAYQTDISQAYGFYFERDVTQARSLLDSAFPDLRSNGISSIPGWTRAKS